MKQEYVIDFECEVYIGRFFGGRNDQYLGTVTGAATTTTDPETTDGLDPEDAITESVVEYFEMRENTEHYLVMRLHSWGKMGIDRNSPIWHKSVWCNP